MAWVQTGKVLTARDKIVQSTLQDAAPGSKAARVSLSMYGELPSGEVAIEEFERFAMDRLRGVRARQPTPLPVP
jgi:hypothetical protein